MDFTQLNESRRSAKEFEEGIEIAGEELNLIFEDVKMAPSAFNLQHTEYIVVLNKELKGKVREAANGQVKVHSSSAVIAVVGNRYAYKNAANIFKESVESGMMTEAQYQEKIKAIAHFYECRGEQFMKDEAIRNGSLSASLFMLAAKNRGWDTCPMIGFDEAKLRTILEVPDTYEIVLMITIGKEREGSQKERGYRKQVGEFVHYK